MRRRCARRCHRVTTRPAKPDKSSVAPSLRHLPIHVADRFPHCLPPRSTNLRGRSESPMSRMPRPSSRASLRRSESAPTLAPVWEPDPDGPDLEDVEPAWLNSGQSHDPSADQAASIRLASASCSSFARLVEPSYSKIKIGFDFTRDKTSLTTESNSLSKIRSFESA